MPHYNLRLAILLSFYALLYTSCEQRPNGQRSQDDQTAVDQKNPFEAGDKVVSTGSVSLWDTPAYIEPKYNTRFPVTSVGFVNDYGHVFSDSQITELEMIALHPYAKRYAAVVTIDSSFTSKDDFGNLVLAIAKDWGIEKRSKRIVIGISSRLNKIEIVTGSGVGAKLTKAEKEKIIIGIMQPEFDRGNYFEGTKKALLALTEAAR